MTLKGFTRYFKPLEILTDTELEAIHRVVLGVLEKTGVKFEHEDALKFLAGKGCKVDPSEMRVRMPPGLVEDYLRKAPTSFWMKSRGSKHDLQMGGNTLYFTTSAGTRSVDLNTWEPRSPTRQDFYDGVKVLDALDSLHYLQSYTPWYGFEGVPPVMGILESAAAKARFSTKVQKEGNTKGCYRFILQMAKAIGADIGLSFTPSPPMAYSQETINLAFDAIAEGCFLMIVAGGLMGASAPATIAGSLVTGLVEVVAGVVFTQVLKLGTPVIVGTMALPQNMKSGYPSFGAIEASLHAVAFSQYFRRHKIPTQLGGAGHVAAKSIDFQAGYERATHALLGALAGYNSISLHGGLYGELAAHPVQAILDDDIAGMIGRFIQGIDVNDETIAADLIEQVGPIPGFYLDKAHTRAWWKKEQFLPKAADRLTYPEWLQLGKKDALDYAKERMEHILATHKPIPLTSSQDAEVEKILEDAREYYKAKGLL